VKGRRVPLMVRTTVQSFSTLAVSRPYHAFPEPAGTRRSPEDSKAAAFEIRRALAEPPGHPRTRNPDGSGP
jgi:hypothetical protein